ncbi:hypothetical protein, partial [Pseudomonas syringae group genomosp. 3]|uniref:hypothetical protein n=1 Tax=Pseudomonas syringae group genomosp. 3 TaxID=251701 RepID=UPI001F34B40A
MLAWYIIEAISKLEIVTAFPSASRSAFIFLHNLIDLRSPPLVVSHRSRIFLMCRKGQFSIVVFLCESSVLSQ